MVMRMVMSPFDRSLTRGVGEYNPSNNVTKRLTVNCGKIFRYHFPADETERINRISPQVYAYNWLQVLGTTETPQIDQGVGHQFHPVVALLDVLETEEQPLEFVRPRKRPLDALPYSMDRSVEQPLAPTLG